MTWDAAEREPDGWIIRHQSYVLGPFPSRETAQTIADATLCGCEKTVEPVHCPPGIVIAYDLPTLIEALKSRQVASDRVN
jgi:hypothetical protein